MPRPTSTTRIRGWPGCTNLVAGITQTKRAVDLLPPLDLGEEPAA